MTSPAVQAPAASVATTGEEDGATVAAMGSSRTSPAAAPAQDDAASSLNTNTDPVPAAANTASAARKTSPVKVAAAPAARTATKPTVADEGKPAQADIAKPADVKIAPATVNTARDAMANAPAANDAAPSAPATPLSEPAMAVAAPQPPSAPAAMPHVAAQTVQVGAHPQPDMPALAVQIAARSQSGARQFDIRLDPPELGRVDVRLSIDASGKASAHLSADQPQTLDLLQKDSSSLTQALRDAGLNVAQDGLNFSLRQQQAGSDSKGSGSHANRGRAASLKAVGIIDTTTTANAYRPPANGRLDIRV